jgi:hypothetical protein
LIVAVVHVVTAPLVITKNEDGSDLYLYFGTSLPQHIKGDELKRLSSEGFIEKLSAEELAALDPSAGPPVSTSSSS